MPSKDGDSCFDPGHRNVPRFLPERPEPPTTRRRRVDVIPWYYGSEMASKWFIILRCSHVCKAKSQDDGEGVCKWTDGGEMASWRWSGLMLIRWDTENMGHERSERVVRVESGFRGGKFETMFFLIGQLTEEKLWKTSILVLPHTDFGSYWKKSPAKNMQNDYVIVLVSLNSHNCANAKISKFYKLCPNLIWLKRKTIQKVSFSGPRN